jgi:diketogulonate reductase-like aldo/keto reductase
MPLFGLGVYLAEAGQVTESAVSFAIQSGYRLIDTAQYYQNEADVGNGFRSSGLKREDVFIVSKVTNEAHGYNPTVEAVKESLQRMKLDYVDMFLIHSPYQGKNVETYEALLDLKKQGLIRSVGVSNFGIAHLEGLKNAGLPAPSVNQIELHPYQRKDDLVKYCQENDIALMGYSPLTRGFYLNDPIFVEIAERYGRSPAQILIRWSVQQGYITIPKSTKTARIIENANVFDFSLSEEDMNKLNSLSEASVSWDPTTSPWEG